jgi:hypothetical protein
MGVAVARFMVVRRWCSASEMGKAIAKNKSAKPHMQEGLHKSQLVQYTSEF